MPHILATRNHDKCHRVVSAVQGTQSIFTKLYQKDNHQDLKDIFLSLHNK
jgi:hypothetical protein